MKISKKIISVILSAIIVLGVVPMVLATEKQEILTAKLRNVYQDNMLFEQKKDAVFEGYANEDDTIIVKLFNSSGIEIKNAETTVDANGKFSVSFVAPAGSYDTYIVKAYCNGVLFKALENVVFGELWVAGGQSNMELDLLYMEGAEEILNDESKRSEWVRFLKVPGTVEYMGDRNRKPVDPQEDLSEGTWITAKDSSIAEVTGVGYFFASKLQKDLDMPVGVIETELGGSTLRTWLSRESIDANAEVKEDMIRNGLYIEREKWDEYNENDYTSMSVQYNKKIHPLRNFRVSGMIWYQGESDCDFEYGMYTRAFTLFQDQMTKLFCYDDGDLPIVMSQLACYPFGSTCDDLQELNYEFSVMAQNNPKITAVSICDVPLTFKKESQACHPTDKKPVGERMAYAAQGLVYGKNDFVGVSTLKSYEIKGSDVFVTLDNVGDTLKVKGTKIYGFTACSKDGVFLPADAEIVSNDTVKVTCEEIKEPVAVRYAISLMNNRSNLYSYKNGEFVMPVSPFATDVSIRKLTWQDFGWTDCDTNSIWRVEDLTTSRFFDIWQGINADVKIKQEDVYEGTGKLEIKANSKNFGVKPITQFTNDEGKQKTFLEFNKDWTNFATISVMVKNNGSSDVKVQSLKVYIGDIPFMIPQVDDKKAIIKANGDWQKVTFDLNASNIFCEKTGIDISNEIFVNVDGVEFNFAGEEDSVISIDDITFTTDSKLVGIISLPETNKAHKIFNFWVKIITAVYDFFKNIYKQKV